MTEGIAGQADSNAANSTAIDQSAAVADALRLELLELRTSVSSTLASFQSTFTTEQSDRANAFRDQLDIVRKESDATRDSLSNDWQRDLATSAEMSARSKESAQATQREIDKIYDIASEKALIGDYSKRANADSDAANFWRWAAIALGGLAIGAALFFLFTHEGAKSTDWGLLVTKALVVLAVGGTAGYAVRHDGSSPSDRELGAFRIDRPILLEDAPATNWMV